ncbi:hypothetical protein [Verrucomicrobium spinosum]|uniref:hypothetical protein n=1 Tax=Verrucomicrobium spinosum TaxID=2736 RepID=UPI000AE200F9|nr:hypothetical protein [Verrucomicrobium spinosum]
MLTFGPHSVIRMPFPCAVKTGTSTNYRDNWTMGFTPEFTVGVWVGNFDNTPMNQVSGVTGAGPVFREIFSTCMTPGAPPGTRPPQTSSGPGWTLATAAASRRSPRWWG